MDLRTSRPSFWRPPESSPCRWAWQQPSAGFFICWLLTRSGLLLVLHILPDPSTWLAAKDRCLLPGGFCPARVATCLQVCDHLQKIGKACGIWVVPIVGGISMAKQERLLRKQPEVGEPACCAMPACVAGLAQACFARWPP